MIKHLNREFEINKLCYRTLHHSGPLVVGGVTVAGANGTGIPASAVANSAGVAGTFVPKVALAVYDFAVDGGVIGAITLANTVALPDNAVVTGITYDVLTTCTSATDAATIALSVPTDGALTTAIAISNAANPWDAGAHLVNTALPKKLTAARNLQITVAAEAITAGKIVFAVQYYVSQ